MGAQNSKLDVECRVEHNIGRLLEREYPLFFGIKYVLPLGYGLLGREGTFVVVADDATQQAVVTNGNPVVVVE